MDLGEAGGLPVVAAHVLDRVIGVWHDYRAIFVSLVLVLALVVFAHSRRQHQRPLRSSSPATEEKSVWSNETPKDVNSGRKDLQSRVSVIENKTDLKKSRPAATRVVTGRKPTAPKRNVSDEDHSHIIKPLIFFSSLTGSTKTHSEFVAKSLGTLASAYERIVAPSSFDLSYTDLDDFFITGPKLDNPSQNERYFYILLIPSYDIDTILTQFLEHLRETHHDFRIDTAPLANLTGYSVFGFGDREGWPDEKSGFCQQAFEVDKWMAKLTGRKRAYPLGLGDVKSNARSTLEEWTNGLFRAMVDIQDTGSLGEGVPGSGEAVESDEEDAETEDFPDNNRQKRRKTEALVDLEDVGGKKTAAPAPLAVDFTTYSDPNIRPSTKPMVPKTSPTYAALTKQGYTIVGSHSGVKICRWTKSALRGRGSCYKNSFYGIASHLCMETTPSLSCSNKCVFCWRHGTNPVSTVWRWEVDDPQMIFDGAKQGHYQKIKMMRGVPGVRADRFEEAMRIKHCALSLVGEPIFYPRINEFLGLLHNEHISSFLVCNAQHPQQLKDLRRVTQLYVSIDASNKDSLKKIDRPLHRDFWERFQACLDILHDKRFIQRTVFRLTLVKGFNMADEAEGYAGLIERGLPCFVEIKGVTFCGTSTSAGVGLTMQNVPFYEEVCAFVEILNRKLEQRGIDKIDGGYGYGIAAEHAHSCCILLASRRFLINNKWHTRIDYGTFFELLEREERTGATFGPEDYCKETEEWALWGNGGFDPRDVRVDRKGRPRDQSVPTPSSVMSKSTKGADTQQRQQQQQQQQLIEI